MDDQVRFLFRELADLTPYDRERIYAERKVVPALRAEVESLMCFDGANGESFTGAVAQAAEEALRSAEFTGPTECGAYRLLSVLGSGGMGTVYLAERNDGEIRQTTAVKLLRAERPAWRERFLRERQLLADLNHPCIARVLDAGHTADGRPYLVMEYVDGVPIDVYSAPLDLRNRLSLFLRVCDGVSHAHQRLIIHRDLKPSNILVDPSGQPKLLDFGIAKLLDTARDSSQTVERLFTPGYASPEQILGGIQTTATDIYSLGAVLHKLLTGRLMPGGNNAEAELTAVKLSSDLQSVLRKALRNEPEERYPSVDAFAEDIRAILEHRPVRARSGNVWYHTRKFLRRYWLPVAAMILAVAGLAGGLWIANSERAVAQRRFSEVRQLSNKLFDIDAEASQWTGSTKTRQLIVDTLLEYLLRLSTQARNDPGLTLELGSAYLRVARVQGISVGPNLGQADEAAKNLRRADELVQSVLAAQPTNRTALLRAAQIAHDRMVLASNQGSRRDALQRAEALALARSSAEWLERFNPRKNDTPEDLVDALGVYMNIADQFVQARQFDHALRLCSRASEIARSINHTQGLGMFLWITAQVNQQLGDLDQALKAIREAVALVDSRPAHINGSADMHLAHVLIWEGRILGQDNGISLGRSEEAVASFERAFQIIDAVVHRDAKNQSSTARLANAGIGLAGIVRHWDAGRALAVYDHMLRHLSGIQGNSVIQRFEADALVGSTYPLRRLHRHAEARNRLDAAFARLSQLKLYPADKVTAGTVTYRALFALADFEAENGRTAGAIEIYEKLLDQTMAAKAEPESFLIDAFDLSNIYKAMATVYRTAGQEGPAASADARRAELWKLWDRKLPHNSFVARQLSAANTH